MAIQFSVLRPRQRDAKPPRLSLVLPEAACRGVLRPIDALARSLVRAGVSANAVTGSCIALGALGGIAIGFGLFGIAAALMIVASLGDALDGMVARHSGSVSVGGALLDARSEERR